MKFLLGKISCLYPVLKILYDLGEHAVRLCYFPRSKKFYGQTDWHTLV